MIFGQLTSLMKETMQFSWSVESWLQFEMLLSKSNDMMKNQENLKQFTQI